MPSNLEVPDAYSQWVKFVAVAIDGGRTCKPIIGDAYKATRTIGSEERQTLFDQITKAVQTPK
jgi:hypothetical protein